MKIRKTIVQKKKRYITKTLSAEGLTDVLLYSTISTWLWPAVG